MDVIRGAFSEMRISIIGAGVVGSAFARQLLLRKITIPEKLFIFEKDEERCNRIRSELSCYGASVIYPTIAESDIIICAVKPQDFSSLSIQLKGVLKASNLFLSVMAGTSIQTIQNVIGTDAHIVRAMPNLPMLVGEAIIPYYSPRPLTEENQKHLEEVLSSCGQSLVLTCEDLVDAATAVSGTGPGYVFYLIEAFTNAACELGFNQYEAKRLISQTFIGSSALYKNSTKDPSTLRGEVTSKGGTTHAAVTVLDNQKVGAAFEDAIKAAYRRAKELSK